MKRLRSYLERRKSKGSTAAGQSQQQPLQNKPVQAPASSSPAPVQDATASPPQAQSDQPVNKTAVGIQATSATLTIALQNNTSSSTVYAFITGQALDNNNAIVLIQSDGQTPYFPSSPSDILQPLQANCAIPLGPPGTTTNATIPHIAGGRIWFSIDTPLTFLLNPGPALVEPSVTNSSDPNANLNWAFAEFTFNSDQLYANISYVDFVSLPIALTLTTVNSGTRSVLGLPSDGLAQIAAGLRAQSATDSQPWDQLIINQPGTDTPLRILSPNQGQVVNPSFLQNYYDPYTSAVYSRFTTTALTIDTQSASGTVQSTPTPDPTSTPTLLIAGEPFTSPSTHDIFTCSTGPFATGASPLRNAIIPRLAAAFNRSTLLATDDIPAPASLYYKEQITNHYSRIVHSVNLDGRGYAFPYDDVTRSGEPDMSGAVNAGDPLVWTVTLGGPGN